MKKVVVFLVLAFAPLFLRPEAIDIASASHDDSLKYYLSVSSITHDAKHLNRNQDINGNYLNTWNDLGLSQQRYRTYVDSRGYNTFEREQIWENNSIPGKYLEKYIWDSNFTWLYLDYSSMNGDIFPSQSSLANCKNGGPYSGCDYVRPAGLEWLRNVTATQSQNNGPAILMWDSSTIGSNQGDHYYQGGYYRFSETHKYCGQVWKKTGWTTSTFRAYPQSTNTAEGIGWQDPPSSSFSDVYLQPDNVYIVRQYSGCNSQTNCSVNPWNTCTHFEDHVYAKTNADTPLAEVMFVGGFTPAYSNWGGSNYAVTHVMISRGVIP